MPTFDYQGRKWVGAIQPHQSIFETSSTREAEVGTIGRTLDGCRFVYCKNGASDLAPNKLVASAANAGSTTVQKNLTVAAADVGADEVTVTPVTDNLTANQFAGGYFGVYDGANFAGPYRVYGHDAINAGETGTIQLVDQIQDALEATDKGMLAKHPCDGVIVYPTTATGIAVGVPLIAVAANEYFWAQTYGPAVCLADGAWTYGVDLVASDTVAGALEVQAAGTNSKAQAFVGHAMNDAADTKYGLVFLRL